MGEDVLYWLENEKRQRREGLKGGRTKLGEEIFQRGSELKKEKNIFKRKNKRKRERRE